MFMSLFLVQRVVFCRWSSYNQEEQQRQPVANFRPHLSSNYWNEKFSNFYRLLRPAFLPIRPHSIEFTLSPLFAEPWFWIIIIIVIVISIIFAVICCLLLRCISIDVYIYIFLLHDHYLCVHITKKHLRPVKGMLAVFNLWTSPVLGFVFWS